MKLIRYGAAGEEKPGILIDNERFDVSNHITAYDEAFFENGGLQHLEVIMATSAQSFPTINRNERWACPVARPSKVICIGLNYADHAKETNASIPSEPIIFMKSTTSLVGPFDDIIIPKNSVKTDWEVELAVVIGKKASYIKESQANDFIAGYALFNDVSEREFQMERNGTWDKGKGCDTFGPMGPYLATTDELPDLDNLSLWLKVNGNTMQDGTTANLIFKIPFLVAYVSQFMTLLPGDIISTGTPAGVGLGFNPPIYLKPGDIVELGIEGLGVQRQCVVAYENH